MYLAEDTTLGRQVAIKILDRAITEEGQFEMRFQREARIVASLQHPHIVTIHSLERVGDVFAIDMPYIDGGSLCDVLEGGNGKRNRVISCVRDTLGALACCHQEGIVHRDVKPSNILVRSDGLALLSDFGLAKLMAEQQAASLTLRSSSGLFLGTPRYAPPESWDGQEAAPTWDVYSVGLVLYESFAPQFPYDASTPMGLVKQIIERPIPPLGEVAEGVSPELSEAVSAMLDRDPAKRPANAAAALDRLSQTPEWTSAGPAGATVVGHIPRRQSPRRRPITWRITRPMVIVALAILILSAAIGIGGNLVLSGLWSDGTQRAGMNSGTGGPASLAPETVFDTLDVATGDLWADHLLLLAPPGSHEWNALAFESTRMWLIEFDAERSTTLQVSGKWARYSDRAASLFEHGDITGEARWVVPNEELSLSLEFRNLQDGTRETGAFVLKKTAAEPSETVFLQKFVSEDFALPLLYNEIIPRNLAWGQTVELLFLTRLSPRLAVPLIGEDVSSMNLDGKITDSEWGHFVVENPDGAGILTESGGDPNNRLLVRYDDKGLYAALTLGVAPRSPEIVLTLVPQLQIPVTESPCYSLLIAEEGVREGRRLVDERQIPWNCNARSAVSKSSKTFEAEVFVPFGDIEGVPAPKSGVRWWLNCAVFDGADQREPPMAQWGAQDPNDVQQGVIFVFGTANEK